MFLKANFKKVLIKPYPACSRDSRKELYDALSPAIYTLLLKNFTRKETAEEVLVNVFIELFRNINDCHSEKEVEQMAYRIASRFLA